MATPRRTWQGPTLEQPTISRGPGKWQRVIADTLREIPVFKLLRCLPRRYTASDVSALHRAARTLAAKGRCELGLLWDEGHRLVSVVCRPGYIFQDGRTFSELAVKCSCCAGGAQKEH